MKNSYRKHSCFDRKWAEEAIGNLVDNAVKYSLKNSEVIISVLDYEMFTAIRVEDSGIGL